MDNSNNIIHESNNLDVISGTNGKDGKDGGIIIDDNSKQFIKYQLQYYISKLTETNKYMNDEYKYLCDNNFNDHTLYSCLYKKHGVYTYDDGIDDDDDNNNDDIDGENLCFKGYLREYLHNTYDICNNGIGDLNIKNIIEEYKEKIILENENIIAKNNKIIENGGVIYNEMGLDLYENSDIEAILNLIFIDCDTNNIQFIPDIISSYNDNILLLHDIAQQYSINNTTMQQYIDNENNLRNNIDVSSNLVVQDNETNIKLETLNSGVVDSYKKTNVDITTYTNGNLESPGGVYKSDGTGTIRNTVYASKTTVGADLGYKYQGSDIYQYNEAKKVTINNIGISNSSFPSWANQVSYILKGGGGGGGGPSGQLTNWGNDTGYYVALGYAGGDGGRGGLRVGTINKSNNTTGSISYTVGSGGTGGQAGYSFWDGRNRNFRIGGNGSNGDRRTGGAFLARGNHPNTTTGAGAGLHGTDGGDTKITYGGVEYKAFGGGKGNGGNYGHIYRRNYGKSCTFYNSGNSGNQGTSGSIINASGNSLAQSSNGEYDLNDFSDMNDYSNSSITLKEGGTATPPFNIFNGNGASNGRGAWGSDIAWGRGPGGNRYRNQTDDNNKGPYALYRNTTSGSTARYQGSREADGEMGGKANDGESGSIELWYRLGSN